MLDLRRMTEDGSLTPFSVALDHVAIAGYSARSDELRAQYIAKLADVGVPPPPRVPMFFAIAPELVTTRSHITVQGARTSGEAEFVVLDHDGELLIGVGSDHTDRGLAPVSIPRSKQVCAKPIGDTFVPYATLRDRWDAIVVACDIRDDAGTWVPYQRDVLAQIMHPDALVADWQQQRRLAGVQARHALLFGGTVPLIDGVTRPATAYRCGLEIPDFPGDLRCETTVSVLPDPTWDA